MHFLALPEQAPWDSPECASIWTLSLAAAKAALSALSMRGRLRSVCSSPAATSAGHASCCALQLSAGLVPAGLPCLRSASGWDSVQGLLPGNAWLLGKKNFWSFCVCLSVLTS